MYTLFEVCEAGLSFVVEVFVYKARSAIAATGWSLQSNTLRRTLLPILGPLRPDPYEPVILQSVERNW
jgi:hypothetical protein